eukprot:Hpha_TRINITY_DN2890_c0_g1::TRINITY_DN2890_c0_g1_i2::g.171397::m.171397/K15430/TRM11, TRMT11; tRNA (guanine10-N2)-methyltransferase
MSGAAEGVKLLLNFAIRPELATFRVGELLACARACGTWAEPLAELREDGYLLPVRFASEDAAREVCSRMVLLHGVMEVWGKGATYDELCKALTESPGKELAERYRNKRFKYLLEAPGKGYSREDKIERFDRFTFLGLKGPVDLKNPEETLCVVEEWQPDGDGKEPRQVLYARLIGVAAGWGW